MTFLTEIREREGGRREGRRHCRVPPIPRSKVASRNAPREGATACATVRGGGPKLNRSPVKDEGGKTTMMDTFLRKMLGFSINLLLNTFYAIDSWGTFGLFRGKYAIRVHVFLERRPQLNSEGKMGAGAGPLCSAASFYANSIRRKRKRRRAQFFRTAK